MVSLSKLRLHLSRDSKALERKRSNKSVNYYACYGGMLVFFINSQIYPNFSIEMLRKQMFTTSSALEKYKLRNVNKRIRFYIMLVIYKH